MAATERDARRPLGPSDWPAQLPLPARYLAGAALGLAAAGVSELLHAWVEGTPFILCFAAVAFCAWRFGTGPSALATLLGGLCTAYWFLPPIGSVIPATGREAFSLGAFFAVSAFMVLLGERARRSSRLAVESASRVQREESRFQHFAESLPQILFTADEQGHPTWRNRRFHEYTGIAESRSQESLMAEIVHPDELPELRSRFQASVRDRTPMEMEFRMRRHDGVYRWFLVRMQPLPDDPARGWLGSMIDVDAQRRAAERARFLAEASAALVEGRSSGRAAHEALVRCAVETFSDSAMVVLLGDDGAVRYEVMAHRKPDVERSQRQLLEGKSWPLDHPATPVAAIREGKPKLIPRVDAAHMARAMPDERLRSALAAYGHVSLLAVPLSVRDRPWGALVLGTDASGRSFDEDDLSTAAEVARRVGLAFENARLLREAQEANRLKDDFLSTVSHELRTPLAAVLGWTDLLKLSTPSPERLARGLAIIDRNARSQARLVDDLLDVSRIITGKLRLAPKAADLRAIAEAALDTLRPAIAARSIQLEADLGDPLPIEADPDRLQQVVWNLLSNSVKFTPPGGTVRLRVAKEGQSAVIEISDTGEGMSADFLPFAFERLRQADQSMTRRQGGLGLGLAIARHLVELHGGHIEAYSDGVGRGSRFTVRLPLTARSQQAVAAAHEPARPQRLQHEPKPLQGLRVLVVDDVEDARELVAEILRTEGSEVEAAADATQALALLAQRPWDVLVSDIAMPGIDGHTLIRAVRKEQPALAAVALTAFVRPEDRARALAAGFDVHAQKPIDAATLVQAVQRAREARQA